MNRYPATPREFEDLMAYLAPVPEDRHADIARMVFREVGVCPTCAEEVRRCDPRRLDRSGRLTHLHRTTDRSRDHDKGGTA